MSLATMLIPCCPQGTDDTVSLLSPDSLAAFPRCTFLTRWNAARASIWDSQAKVHWGRCPILALLGAVAQLVSAWPGPGLQDASSDGYHSGILPSFSVPEPATMIKDCSWQ